MASILDWTAQTEGGETLTREAAPRLFANVARPADLPDEQPWPLRPEDARGATVRDLLVQTDRGPLRALIRPANGERIRVFTRRAIRVLPQGGSESLSVPVVEIEVGGERVRLYVVDNGMILSTEDINF